MKTLHDEIPRAPPFHVRWVYVAAPIQSVHVSGLVYSARRWEQKKNLKTFFYDYFCCYVLTKFHCFTVERFWFLSESLTVLLFQGKARTKIVSVLSHKKYTTHQNKKEMKNFFSVRSDFTSLLKLLVDVHRHWIYTITKNTEAKNFKWKSFSTFSLRSGSHDVIISRPYPRTFLSWLFQSRKLENEKINPEH